MHSAGRSRGDPCLRRGRAGARRTHHPGRGTRRRGRRLFARAAGLLAAAAALQCLLPPKAHAYLDPGTGSYMFQVAIGALLAGLFTLKASWRRLVGFLKTLLPGRRPDDHPDR